VLLYGGRIIERFCRLGGGKKNKESPMSISSKQRLISVLAVLAMLGILLFQAAPVFAQSGGTAPYTVKPGDTLKQIADDYGLTVEKMVAANPAIRDPNLIYTGQVLILPVGRSEGPASVRSGDRIFVWQREKDGGKIERSERLYLVRSGDSLKRVADAYGITIEKLLTVNPQLDDATMLLRGELIHIPYGLAERVPSFYQTPAAAPTG
jgi:LysM repeat protein